jgi:hypothetical protein
MSSKIDDGTIPDGAGLLRRIHPDQVVMDGNSGHYRPSSAAFKDPELSVDAEPILHSQGLDWKFSILKYPTHSLVRFMAKAARELQLPVVPDPRPDNSSHTLVLEKKSPGKANKLRDSSSWVHCLPP